MENKEQNDIDTAGLGRLIARWVNDDEAVKDIRQDTLLKLHLHRDKIKTNERSWLYKVARNEAMDYLNRKQRQSSAACAEKMADPDPENYNEAVINCMLSLIPALEKKYRQVLELSVYSQLSQKDIAEQLGLSYTAVKSRIQRGRKLLLLEFLSYCNIRCDKFGNIIFCEDKICL